MTKAFIIALSAAVLLAALNVWQWQAAHAPRPDLEAMLQAQEAYQETAINALEAKQKDELAQLTTQRENDVRIAESARREAAARTIEVRAKKIQHAQESPVALKQETAQTFGIDEDLISEAPDALTIRRVGIIHAIGLTLELKDRLSLAGNDCAVALALQRKELEIPLVAARQAAELTAQRAIFSRDAERTRAEFWEKDSRKSRNDLIWYSIGCTIGGVLVGGALYGGLHYAGKLP